MSVQGCEVWILSAEVIYVVECVQACLLDACHLFRNGGVCIVWLGVLLHSCGRSRHGPATGLLVNDMDHHLVITIYQDVPMDPFMAPVGYCQYNR